MQRYRNMRPVQLLLVHSSCVPSMPVHQGVVLITYCERRGLNFLEEVKRGGVAGLCRRMEQRCEERCAQRCAQVRKEDKKGYRSLLGC